MLLGLLNIKQGDIGWIQQVLAGTCQVMWQVQELSHIIRHQRTKPVELLLIQLDGQGTAPDFQQILANLTCPVMLFSTDGLNHTNTVFNALGCGVKDYVGLKGQSNESACLLLKKIKQQSVLTQKTVPVPSKVKLAPILVAIGASTGGPACLNTLVQSLPEDLSAALVIVQHMESRFSAGLVDWLEQSSKLKVKLIEHQEQAIAGVIYIAGADLHLQISAEGCFIYSEEPRHSIFKPSIDLFFESVSKNWCTDAIGVLLTGMGQDGAQGMKLMKEKGWLTIAQDQASSVVYGMPKAAVSLKAATEVLPLNQIAARLITLCGSK
jgi:two-component system, chemotaxis family, response regulator WspF